MSQARARTFQTVKSLNLYKLCSVRNASSSHFSINSLKALSFLKKLSTLSSAATDEGFDIRNPNEFPGTSQNYSGYGNDWSIRESNSQFDQNPNGVYGGNSMDTQRNISGAYGQSYNYNRNDQNTVSEYSSNRLYEGGNVQSSYNMNNGMTKEVIGGGNDQYPNYTGIFQENQGYYIMGGDGLHSPNQCNGMLSYINNAYGNQQSSVTNYQIPNGSNTGVVISPLSNFPQSSENSDNALVDRRLLGSLEELDAFCKYRKLKEVVMVMGYLEQNNISVDIPRYLSFMKTCGESRALGEAKYVHNHLKRSVHHLDIHIHNKILEMYSKCGSMKDAYKVFDKMPQRNLTSWDTMILWLAKNGHREDAIDMFTEFKRIGLKPDNQMFRSVFTACNYLQDTIEGMLHFKSMTKTYNLVPSMDDYVSVVDMLGSSGYLQEAMEFIEKMPVKPSVEIWEIMMKQSWIHGDLELGDRCAETVDLLEPSRLDKHSKQGLLPMKPLKIKEERIIDKDPLTFKTQAREFRSGDLNDPDNEKLYILLRCLTQSAKEAGYVPLLKFALHDLDDENKEDNLFAHSERIALARGILNSPPRADVRIFKNLRVCVDCHNFLKFASKLVGRKIIARDNKRFHLFENGKCNCGDFW